MFRQISNKEVFWFLKKSKDNFQGLSHYYLVLLIKSNFGLVVVENNKSYVKILFNADLFLNKN